MNEFTAAVNWTNQPQWSAGGSLWSLGNFGRDATDRGRAIDGNERHNYHFARMTVVDPDNT
ncbi:MAG TPA: hypothetical protein VGQ65_22345, partial [Thermoanaerobaculia bacterium]|nr:hypothetical protein [Thermoanaerobaculia bacterium]